MPRNVAEVASAYDAGQNFYQLWRKNPTQTTGTGIWFDLSLSPGTPTPNYYIGGINTSTALTRADNGGIDHGPNVSPLTKRLHKFLAMTATATAVPLPLILCDYLMFYPFIEQTAGDTDLTNSITLPRYPTGAGTQMIAVLQNAQAGGSQFNVTYTNQDGVAGRVTPTMTCNTQTVPGTLINTSVAVNGSPGPYIPLQAGDSGVRSIERVTFLSSDIGLFALVIVKPLVTALIYDTTAPTEIDFLTERNVSPVIVDNAFLGTLCLPSGTIAGSALIGELQTYWS